MLKLWNAFPEGQDEESNLLGLPGGADPSERVASQRGVYRPTTGNEEPLCLLLGSFRSFKGPRQRRETALDGPSHLRRNKSTSFVDSFSHRNAGKNRHQANPPSQEPFVQGN